MNLLRQQDETSDDEEGHLDPADAMLQRGAFLRKLREMEMEDELARRDAPVDAHADHTVVVDPLSTMNDSSDVDRDDDTSAVDKSILDYNSYLRHQRFYDDLKHVDYKFMDYGNIIAAVDDDVKNSNGNHLVIEQDKSLGKGGLCWDAAFCLGEHLIATQQYWMQTSHEGNRNYDTSIIELGCGTGLCGLMVAKSCPRTSVCLTDLPSLMPILHRNVHRNFEPNRIINNHEFATQNHLQNSSSDTPANDGLKPDDDDDDEKKLEPLVGQKISQGFVSSFVLDWDHVVTAWKKNNNKNDLAETNDQHHYPYFDVVIGADVVATLYDPQALARTIHHVAKDETSLVYISFKERLSSIHRTFERAMGELFEHVEIQLAPKIKSRNRNPDVGILVARGKRMTA